MRATKAQSVLTLVLLVSMYILVLDTGQHRRATHDAEDNNPVARSA